MIKKFKVGTVQSKKDRSGVTIAVGNANAKNEKYRTSVEITVKDANGNVLAQVENGYLVVQDPRKRDGITEEQLAKIPDWIKSEVFVVVDDGQ
jgi:hypothetical protein